MDWNEKNAYNPNEQRDTPGRGRSVTCDGERELMFPQRRAFAKKRILPRSMAIERQLGNVDIFKNEATNSELVNLNEQFLKEMSEILDNAPSADLCDIISQYKHFSGEILELGNGFPKRSTTAKNIWRGRRNIARAVWNDAELRRNYREIVFGAVLEVENSPSVMQEHRSAMYDALCAMYDHTISARQAKDSLSELLEANILQEPQNEATFAYVRTKDVIKSKGNSIKGPKREDIGKYNRKLFDMHNGGKVGHPTAKILVNPKFFDELQDAMVNFKINKCELCAVCYFNGGEMYEIGDFFMTIHSSGDSSSCSIVNSEGYLFKDLRKDEMEMVYIPGCANILFLHQDTFVLYNVAFISPDIASSVYDTFVVQ
ncbi:hypothetical protein PAEPH01_0590 [Pancytospora epiphaga]|nr:hypothetical protein PAEPH01_0590 [Pancytospora epiphaga]